MKKISSHNRERKTNLDIGKIEIKVSQLTAFIVQD